MANTSKYRPRYDTHGVALHTGERQRKTGTYEYQYKDSTGVWKRISAPTLPELREKEKEVNRDASDNIRAGSKEITLDYFYAKWKQTKAGLRDNVRSNYMDMYASHVQPKLGKRNVKTIKTSDVKALYNNMLKDGYAVGTIDNVHTILHQILQLAYEDDYIRRNPSDGCMKEIKRSAKQTPGRKRVALTPEQQERLRYVLYEYNHSEYLHWYPIYIFAMHTGLRLGEFTALQWSDIDFAHRTVTVSKTLVYYMDRDTGKQTLAMHPVPKTDTGNRTIPLSNLALGALKLQYAQTRQHGKQCAVTVDKYDDFVFLNRFNAPYTQGSLNKALRDRIIPAANEDAIKHGAVILPSFSCHSLRHTFCSNLCRADINIKTIQKLMGHSDIQTTLDVYTEFTGKELQQGVTQLDDWLTKH